MLPNNRVRRLSLAAAAVCAGCASSSSAPKGWLPEPVEAQADTYGGWIELSYGEEKANQRADGELIAVSPDSVWVLNGVRAFVIATATVTKGRLTAYAPRKGQLTTWAVLGGISTLSNGAFLIFTAPMWIIGGSLAVGSEVRAAQRRSPPLNWVELAPFARFPQGLPQGMELSALEARKMVSPPTPR